MSNSVTQSELEDVLAAIRRLVAEEREEPSAMPGGAQPVAGAEKLVLTPALRVHAGSRPDAPDQTSEDSQQAAARAPVHDDAPDDAIPPRQVNDTVLDDALPEGDAADVMADDGVSPAVAGDAASSQEQGDNAAVGQAFDRPRHAERAQESKGAETGDQDHPHDLSETGAGAGVATTDPASPLDAPDVSKVAEEAADMPAAEDGVAGPAASQRAATLESKIAELEAMVGMNGGWEPDQGDALPFAPAQGADSAFETEADNVAEATDDDRLEMEETVLDEEMLRDMVAEIVRQELQGELGERITRNVRKLVRREVHRALTAHLFD